MFLSHLVSDGRRTDKGSFTSLQTIPWMDVKVDYYAEPGSNWNFALEMQAACRNHQPLSTDFRKLIFTSMHRLAAVNLAKAACKRLGIAYSSSCKSFIHNAYMLERFICNWD